MSTNSLPRNFVQISEEVLPPIHVPLVLDNDLCILTQQDVRKIQESRFFTISKMLPNGSLKIINSLDTSNCLELLAQLKNYQGQQAFNSLLEFLNCPRYNSHECPQSTSQQSEHYFEFNKESSCLQPMEVSVPADTVASMSQQLKWNKYTNTSAPFPIHYSHGTSTTEIDCKLDLEDGMPKTCNRCKTSSRCEKCTRYSDKSTNVLETQSVCNKKSIKTLDAREQLKRNKIRKYST